MFKFQGLKSLPDTLQKIDFKLSVFINKTTYCFCYDYKDSDNKIVTSDRFFLSKKQFLEFHNEVEDKATIPFLDYVFYYNERL